MTLLRVDSSIRTTGSVSREVADSVETAFTGRHPDVAVVRRDLGLNPLPADAWAAAVSAAGTLASADRTPQQREAAALAARLADELLAADALIVAAPLYNFGVPQHLKTWIDLLLTDPRFAPGAQPLAGRPATLVVARGGGYGPGTPREGWDHATPYLLRILADALGAEVALIAAELTLADLNPDMAPLRELAATSRAQAHEMATQTGHTLAARHAAARAA